MAEITCFFHNLIPTEMLFSKERLVLVDSISNFCLKTYSKAMSTFWLFFTCYRNNWILSVRRLRSSLCRLVCFSRVEYLGMPGIMVWEDETVFRRPWEILETWSLSEGESFICWLKYLCSLWPFFRYFSVILTTARVFRLSILFILF